MIRISAVENYLEKVILTRVQDTEKRDAFKNAYGAAQCCSLMALKRGTDRELSYICGLLLNIYSYFTGSAICHGESGADMVRVALKKTNLFTKEELKLIVSGIFYHSRKRETHDDFCEAIKDGDVLYHLTNYSEPLPEKYKPRISSLIEELKLNIPESIEYHAEEKISDFSRSTFADIAGDIAQRRITGEKNDPIYMDLIKYYPENSAFHELMNSWCAAFVYHCAVQAGLKLPIRKPPYDVRFAGVGPWYKFGKDNGFCLYPEEGCTPERGDIVIYDNIIPPENKPQNSLWHDHIAIVVDVHEDFIYAAEGNVDNLNTSGIKKRHPAENIGCYIRIPDSYIYSGFKGDYSSYLRDKL